MFNKSYLWFGASVLCALLAFSYLFWVYLNWDEALDTVENDSAVEVTLPVINWEKYMELSKRIE